MNRVDIMLFDLDNTTIKEYIRQAEFGIERESLRRRLIHSQNIRISTVTSAKTRWK